MTQIGTAINADCYIDGPRPSHRSLGELLTPRAIRVDCLSDPRRSAITLFANIPIEGLVEAEGGEPKHVILTTKMNNAKLSAHLGRQDETIAGSR
jgi:hypothetical protein